jgi:hypothetical protein
VLSLLQDAIWTDRARRRDRYADERTRPYDDRY